ncbi:hypothetical protein EV424DRAFT_1323556, partial [Suillus variegatus]
IFAPVGERWTSARVKWWRSQAEDENRHTLIRYLLDNLSTYENYHSDALCSMHEWTAELYFCAPVNDAIPTLRYVPASQVPNTHPTADNPCSESHLQSDYKQHRHHKPRL